MEITTNALVMTEANLDWGRSGMEGWGVPFTPFPKEWAKKKIIGKYIRTLFF
jgi:hypothetical protein